MTRRLPSLLLACALVLLAAGCGRVHTRYFTQLDDKTISRAEKLDEVYASPRAPFMVGRQLEVRLASPLDTVQAATAKMHKPEDWATFWEEWRVDFEDYIADMIWKAGVFDEVGTPPDITPLPKPDYVLEVAITEWNEGRGWLRWLLGFGLGATRMQWEGKMTETSTGREVFAFADARLHPGGPSLIFSRKPFHGNKLINEDLHWAAQDLARTLRSVTQTAREVRPKDSFRRIYRPEMATPAAGDPPAPAAAPDTAGPQSP